MGSTRRPTTDANPVRPLLTPIRSRVSCSRCPSSLEQCPCLGYPTCQKVLSFRLVKGSFLHFTGKPKIAAATNESTAIDLAYSGRTVRMLPAEWRRSMTYILFRCPRRFQEFGRASSLGHRGDDAKDVVSAAAWVRESRSTIFRDICGEDVRLLNRLQMMERISC